MLSTYYANRVISTPQHGRQTRDLKMLFALFMGSASVAVAGALFSFVFMRSSKDLPRTLPELKAELAFQWLGFTGVLEDHMMRFKNQTKLINQPGRIVVITGGNRGIGLAVVTALLRCEYTVIMGVRDPAQAKAAVTEALAASKRPIPTTNLRIHYERLDIGDMSSVRAFAQRVRQQFPRIHVLINNAGIMATPYRLTVDGFEEQLAVNYLGHFLLAHLLLPVLRAGGTDQAEQRARIVNVSSCVQRIGKIDFEDLHGKKFSYPPIAYSQSKLAQVLFTKHLQTELNARREERIQTHSVHPGIVDTGLFSHSMTTYVPWFKRIFFKSASQGARSILHAVMAPHLEGKGGSYVSNCTMMRTQRASKDEALCARLFTVTCKELGIDDFFKVVE